ncbi:MAG TPA: TolC family protein [Acidobacteriaceae bacterium]|nr:TolC family protein [Acidobacteriaceae bacterium]
MPGSERRKAALGMAATMLALVLPLGARGQISLSTAVELAEKNSPSVRSAAAGVRQAAASLTQTRDAYIPNFTLGTSPGYAYGFPLGQPSLFTATSQSLAFSFSQPDYVRAARQALNSARLSLKDTQQQVALDVALDYVELDHDLEEIAALGQEKDDADQLAQIEQQRVAAGVDPRVSQLQAELTAAQVDEKRIHLQNDADEMRQKLGHLTGLPADGLTTVSNSVPPPPALSANAEDDQLAAQNNAGLAAALANAKSKSYVAFGDSRQDWRPSIIFGAQYSYFEPFANYTQYYNTTHGFQYNNAGIGLQITVPIFDAAKRAQAQISAAAAARAQADADASRDQLSEGTLALRRTILELTAQQRVARLQDEISQEQLKSVESELANGSGSPTAPAATPIQARLAGIQERERYEDMLDANFVLMKAELNLLRATGQITSWILSSVK